MSESLGSAYVEIIARLDKLQQGLDKGEAMTKRSSKKMQEDMSKVATSADTTYNRWLDHIGKVDRATSASSNVFLRAREQEQRAIQRLGVMQSSAWKDNEAFDRKRLAQLKAIELQQAKIQNAGLRKGDWSSATTEAEGFNRTLARISRTMAAFAAVSFTIALVKGFQELVSSGIQFNKEIESAKLGIGSIISTQGEFVTATGQQLQGVEKLNAALFMSDKLVNQLRIDNLKTTATFEQLTKAFQQTLAPGLGVGFNPDQVRKFTLSMMQAAGAMGVNQDMMAEETRSLLKGTITPRNTIIATALGITNEQIRSYKGNAQGLFDFLMGRLKEFQYAGELSQKIFTGLASNLKDAFMGVTGQSFEPLFNRLKEMMAQGIGSLVNISSSGISSNPAAISFFSSTNDAVVNSINYLEEFGRGLLGLDQKFQNFDSNRDTFYKLGLDIKNASADIKPFVSMVGEMGSKVSDVYNAMPDGIREYGLVGLILYGLQKKHPYLAAIVGTLAVFDKLKEATQDQPTSMFGLEGAKQEIDYLSKAIEEAGNKFKTALQSGGQNEVKSQVDGLVGTFKQFETQSMNTGQAYGYFTDYLGQSTYKINETKKSAEDLAKELDKLERNFSKFENRRTGLFENIGDQLRSAKIRLSVAQSGMAPAEQSVEVTYQEKLDKIRDYVDKSIKEGQDIALLMKDANILMSDAFETRSQELKTITENEKNSNDKKFTNKPTFELDRINQDFNRFDRNVRKVYQDLIDIDDEYNIKKQEASGNFLYIEQKNGERWIRQQQSQYEEYLINLENSIQEMRDKANKSGKVDPKVLEGIRVEEEKLVELLGQQEAKKEDIRKKGEEILAINIKIREAENKSSIAQLNLEYAQLTGTMQEQLALSILRLRTESDLAKLQNPELAGLIDRNTNAKINYESATKGDSFTAGFGAAYDKWRTEIPAMGQMGAEAFGQVTKAIDSAADALTQFVMTGKMDFTSFATSIITDLIRMQIRMQMMQMLGGGSGGGLFGVGSFLTSLLGMSGGYGHDAALGKGGYGIVPYHHSGALVGYTNSPSKMVDMSIFNNAPRLHNGLGDDEFPAILQKGERVTRKGGSAGISVPKPNIIINNNGQAVEAKEAKINMNDLREMQVEITLDILNSNGAVRNAVQSAARG